MTVNKYIKKPIPIEAIQWTGNNFDQFCRLAGDKVWIDESGYLNVKTLEGSFRSKNRVGDYFIKGEFYICEKQIFEESYQRV